MSRSHKTTSFAMDQIQYLLDCVNGRNYEEPDESVLYSDQNSNENYEECFHKPEVHSAATSPKDKFDPNVKPTHVVNKNKKKSVPTHSGKKHAVSSYSSPFVREAQERARERARALKKKQFEQPEWSKDVKVPLLFDPSVKKQDIFKLRPRNVQYGYEFDDGNDYLPSNTNDPTLLRRRTNASNTHYVVQGPPVTDNRQMTRRTTGYAPVNNPMNRINTTVPETNIQHPSSPIRVERLPESHHPSPVHVRHSSPSPVRHEEHHYTQPSHPNHHPHHHRMHRNVHPVSRSTSPVTSSDLNSCPSLFDPSRDSRANPYLTATTVLNHEVSRCTSPFDERELADIFGYSEDFVPYPYSEDHLHPPQHGGENHHHSSPTHHSSTIEVPKYRPSVGKGGSEVEYFTDIIREKLSRALSADVVKRPTVGTPKSALKQRTQTPPPPPPPVSALYNNHPSNQAQGGTEALMAGMGHLMTAVGDIITATRQPPPYPYYGGSLPAWGTPPVPVRPQPKAVNSGSGVHSATNKNLFTPPSPHATEILQSMSFNLAGVNQDPSQHISSNFLNHKTNNKKAGKTKPSKSPMLHGLAFAPIGAPPAQSRSELMDVILQKLQSIDQSEREIHHFLQMNTISANGSKFYPSTRVIKPLPPSKGDNQHTSLLDRAYANSDSDDDDEDNNIVKYTPGEADLEKYLSLHPPAVPHGVLNHNTYEHTKPGSLKTRAEPFKSQLKKHSLLSDSGYGKSTREERNILKEVEYLNQFPKLKSDPHMNDEVMKFMKELDIARQMKDVAFQCRGVSMAQVADTATDAIMSKLLDGVTDDVDGFIGKYSEKFIDKI